MLISDYMTLPKRREDPNWWAGKERFEKYVTKNFSWRISPGDRFISNIENIIIWILMLWGFLRCIDLLKIIQGQENKELWLCFWENTGYP